MNRQPFPSVSVMMVAGTGAGALGWQDWGPEARASGAGGAWPGGGARGAVTPRSGPEGTRAAGLPGVERAP